LPASPLISVIIIAFNRKEFLFQALSSAINQSLDKSKYEIIVVKNFQDEKIDSLIEKSGIISLERGNEIVGSYIAAGIERSKGEVLAFLDDDDEFTRDKLLIVEEIFTSNSTIGYYHNGIVTIDSSGNVVPIDFRKRTIKFVEETGRFFIRKPMTGNQADKLFRAAAYGYLSSIVVRKSVVVPFLSYLKSSIESVQDIFTFYCALLSNECSILVVDPQKLTRYRMHESNVSLFLDMKKNSNSKNEARISKFLSREERSLESIMKMSLETNDKDQKNLRVVRKMIGYELYNRKLDLEIVDPSSNKRRMLSDSIKFFKYSFRSRFLGSQVSILVRSLLWVFFPRTTKKSFVRRFASQGT
jgi:glycosyltransferase involved in cell wall biosynthesis